MEPIPIILPEGKYLSQIEPFKSYGLDTDCHYDKTVTGCGFTRYAIEFFESNLIAGLPSKPVVEAKVNKHNRNFPDRPILGVYKGISIAKIKAYLASNVKYKKIITTPEGFNDKITKAFSDLSEMYDNFYMLIDESDRIVNDVSYRGAIAAPMNHFFKFKRKSMVTATRLPLSDPRFAAFKEFVIVPDYDYSKKITVINTTNVIQSLKRKLDGLNSKHVSIFFNSTKGISAVIKGLELTSNYMVFCAEDSVIKLYKKDIPYKRATDEFSASRMEGINFFTSRYFSAIDIELKYKPDVILVSDIVFAGHSILDPKSEVIQISGRFREGINSLTHVTNFNPDLKTKTPEQAKFYLEGLFEAYNDFVQGYEIAANPGRKDAYFKAMTESKAHSFYVDGEINSAMVDNFIHEERVKEYYKNPTALLNAYAERSKHFVVTYEEEFFDADDKDLFKLQKSATKKEKYKRASEMLYDYKLKSFDHIILFRPTGILTRIRAMYPEIAEGVDHLDQQTLNDTNFVLSEIRKAVDDAKETREIERIAPYIYELIDITTHIQSDLKVLMEQAYLRSNTNRKLATDNIRLFFKAERTTEGKKNVYKLKERIFLIDSENSLF